MHYSKMNVGNIHYSTFEIENFNPENAYSVIQKGTFRLTHYTNSRIEGTLCFALDKANAIKATQNDNIHSIITSYDLAQELSTSKGIIATSSPKKLFFEIHNALGNYYSFQDKDGFIASSASIHPTAVIMDNVFIGERTKIGAYAIIEDGSVVGDDVLIDHHVIIGARGMHNTNIDGRFISVTDLGNVVIGNRCEILSNAVIQKPYFYHSGTIGEETRISVHCDIGHGCTIGERCLIAGHTVVAGYCSIGNNVWIGPNSTISHLTKIDDNASIMLGSVVIGDVAKSEKVSGNFAYDHVKNFRRFVREKR